MIFNYITVILQNNVFSVNGVIEKGEAMEIVDLNIVNFLFK